MCRIRILATILYLLRFFSLHHAHHQISADEEIGEPDNNFDIIVFAQEWPVTVCKKWIHGTGRQCVYPKQKNQWTVHGIWPRKMDGKYTVFCNSSWVFNPEQIKSIEGDLEQAWTNIYKEEHAYKFWAHEWLKHGTCAAVFELFNSQLKYFSKGIEWNHQYSLSGMLDAANIFPDDTKEFAPEEFVNAVKDTTKRNPMVVCRLLDEVQFLEELRVCVDKQFHPIDCDPVIFNTCDVSKSIIFPATA